MLTESAWQLIVEEGAHHLDFMFSHDLDPAQVKQVLVPVLSCPLFAARASD